MLTKISISNFALIESLELDLKDGLTTVTGETGAGKSILLGALGLIQGKRADLSAVRDSNKKCVVEAEFDIRKLEIEDFFRAWDLDFDNLTILRREILPSGKSRAFVNDTPVNLKVLSSLSDLLIDIHSQHQTLELTKDDFQLAVIHTYADQKTKGSKNDSAIIREEYQNNFKSYQSLKLQFKKLKAQESELTKELDYNSFLLNELLEVKLEQLNEDDLQSEYDQLSNVETISESLEIAEAKLSQDDHGVLDVLRFIKQEIDPLSTYKKEYQSIAERLESARLELEDLSNEISLESSNLESDPERVVLINQQLSTLNNLYKKHQVNDVNSLIELRDRLDSKVNASLSFEDDLNQLSIEINTVEKQLLDSGKRLRAAYNSHLKDLAQKIELTAQSLGMPQAQIELLLEPLEQPNIDGLDRAVFLFTANKGSKKLTLDQAASGGELSRLMLGIKAVMSESKVLPTIIFDEIDTGVSGAIAEKMAQIMKQMCTNMQVLSITHLPQIAASGTDQLKVYKTTTDDSTISNLTRLNPDERVEEIAQMLSGNKISDAARENARILLN